MGGGGQALETDVLQARSKEAALRSLQRFLIERLAAGREDRLVTAAVSWIYRHSARVSIDRLASALGVTRRELERRFRTVVGQRPVEVRSLSRMQKVMRDVLLHPTHGLTDAALSQGYYDQAHFIRAFAPLSLGPPQRHLKTARARSHFYNTSWPASVSNVARVSIGALFDEPRPPA
jgi:methylphosphotriester-DNA--protein-cysteine methyltransferase